MVKKEMICKNLAYSMEQVASFLGQTVGVKRVNDTVFRYGQIRIELKPFDGSLHAHNTILHGQGEKLTAMERSYMCLWGDEEEIHAFYKKFMIYHMTMGG